MSQLGSSNQWGAAAAAQARHDATVRFFTLLLHVTVPFVAHVCGNAEDCKGHKGARNASTNKSACIIMRVGHIHSSLATNCLASSRDVSLTDIANWVLGGTE